ncbi:hypothetical protein COU61_01000 [Candidatus Pacearchaeota archaeon CG10_big_fil_rev_8_21_14_0_10_35_13]|nr:MAG: hypothetical protein COU61_01000 [Candidatus Pacearchaeota archaeon CG10_big_fil_rev_8_21_14_0_10_35_13]
MKKRGKGSIIFWLMVLGIIIVGTIIFKGLTFPKSGSEVLGYHNLTPKACINNENTEKCYTVEIAKTPDERSQGLMFREELGINEGMIFIFPERSNWGFWMKNTQISLDILWLGNRGEVLFLKEGAEPCPADEDSCTTTTPPIEVKAKYVLELNSGEIEKNNIKLGSKIVLKNINTP